MTVGKGVLVIAFTAAWFVVGNNAVEGTNAGTDGTVTIVFSRCG
jgi:hypothetical protein